MEYNNALARKYPDNQKQFALEYEYSNPNNYCEMLGLYNYYGYKYSRSLWAYQQLVYEKSAEEVK